MKEIIGVEEIKKWNWIYFETVLQDLSTQLILPLLSSSPLTAAYDNLSPRWW
jgi:hypothetical protein